MSKLELFIGPATIALRFGRAVSLVLGTFLLWAICAMLAPLALPHWQIVLAHVGTPIALILYVLLVIWSSIEARKQPPHKFEE